MWYRDVKSLQQGVDTTPLPLGSVLLSQSSGATFSFHTFLPRPQAIVNLQIEFYCFPMRVNRELTSHCRYDAGQPFFCNCFFNDMTWRPLWATVCPICVLLNRKHMLLWIHIGWCILNIKHSCISFASAQLVTHLSGSSGWPSFSSVPVAIQRAAPR